MNLENINISYIIVSSEKLDDVISVLYAKEYDIIEMKNYEDGKFKESILAYGIIDNDTLRRDTIFILEEFNISSSVIKYKGEKNARKLLNSGGERQLSVSMYSENCDSSYIYKGLSFSFYEMKRYWIPKSKEDFRVGMIVELLNNNQWIEKLVENPADEYERIYKLMLKYNKLRVPSLK